ncbi:hypothetical protein BKA00_004251 [Actinomadura coerulea]|uniref:Amidase domain-containing protein n=1 Tax=Actinomadura coerulea TaxID=46159 RepID=A0A7X0L0C1_9ACTN|nr:hypothetical protein [Actinomadura coerulea]GGQ02012.1 hypothetical protein GCM10010187_17040 [Actinomadura coerulea]
MADAAAVFEVIATPRRAIRLETGLPGARIGVWSGIRWGGHHPDVNRVLAEATAKLHEMGATIVEVVLPTPDTTEVLPYEFKVSINDYLSSIGGDHPRDLDELIAFGRHPAERTSDLGMNKFERSQDSDMARPPEEYPKERIQITEETRGSMTASSDGTAWRDRGSVQRPGPEDLRARPPLGALLLSGGGRRVSEHHGPGRVRRCPSAAGSLVHRTQVLRRRAPGARLLLRAGDPGTSAAPVPAHALGVTTGHV